MQTEIVLSAPERLRVARQRAGLDQAEMGAVIGVHRAVISQYENGHTEPTLSALVRWADVADVSLDWLCARRDSNPQPSDLYPGDDAIEVEYELLLLVEAVRS
jgi:transcriptional regulator with XRE-family HTH domain